MRHPWRMTVCKPFFLYTPDLVKQPSLSLGSVTGAKGAGGRSSGRYVSSLLKRDTPLYRHTCYLRKQNLG